MKDTIDNPLADYMSEQIKFFTNEGIRLRDKQPLADYKKLADTFFFIVRKLGTIEHDVALEKLSSEFKVASGEAADTWRQIWRNFREQRREAIRTEQNFAESDQKGALIIAKLEKSLSEMRAANDEFRKSMKGAIDAAKNANKTSKKLSTGWRRFSLLTLWMELQIYTLYLRYFAAKGGFFLFRHGFILLVPILLFGILFSQLSKLAIEELGSLFPQWPWFVGALTVCAYIFKKYYLDARLKKLQVRMETRRLRPLAFQLHIVRTMTLVTKTIERREQKVSVNPESAFHLNK